MSVLDELGFASSDDDEYTAATTVRAVEQAPLDPDGVQGRAPTGAQEHEPLDPDDVQDRAIWRSRARAAGSCSGSRTCWRACQLRAARD